MNVIALLVVLVFGGVGVYLALVGPVRRLVVRMVEGHARERAEAKLRHPSAPSVRVYDIGDAAGTNLRLGAAANLLGEEAEEFLAAEDALRMLRSSASPDAHRWARWIELDAQTDRRWAR